MGFAGKCLPLVLFSIVVCLAGRAAMASEKARNQWTFEAEDGDINVGLNGVIEADPRASGKKTIVAKTGRNLANVYHRPLYKGPCSMEYPFGEYEAVFRMKVGKTKGTKPVVQIELRKEGSRYSEPALKKWVFKPTDFARPNSYQNIKIQFEHVPNGWLQLHVVWRGETDFAFDCYKLKLVRRFGAEELAKRWPYSPLRLESRNDETFEVLFLKGPFYQYQRVEEALHKIEHLKVYDAYMQKSYVFWDYSLDGYFPDINEHWYGLDVVILGGIDAESLGLKRRRRVSEFVTNCGGGLMMLPGPYSFGKGRFKGTSVEQVLPVRIDSPWDWKRLESPCKVEVTDEIPEITKDLNFGSNLHTLWYTSAKLRPDAKVILRAGDVPLVVVSKAGKGRTAAVLALPCGQWPDEQTPFWVSDDWKELMKRLVIWLGNGDAK